MRNSKSRKERSILKPIKLDDGQDKNTMPQVTLFVKKADE
jgi:hypothetical protein